MSFLVFLAGALALGFFGARFLLVAAYGALFLWWWGASTLVWVPYLLLVALFGLPPLRRAVISGPLAGLLKRAGLLPAISDTEREALEAGGVWFEGELFGGSPDWARLMRESYPRLNDAERAFLDGPVEEVCAMTDDWLVFQKRGLAPKVWAKLREDGFFGMIIPKQYGGLEFSSTAVSAVIAKLSSRSIPLGITAMLPNSLGPAELLLHYGTEQQKDRLLPRLATGEEVPCFALTEPHAGSDAGSMRARGVVFRAEDGTLMLRLSWQKRYITMASIATTIGLAFKLEDPDNLLGRGTAPGITAALVPGDTPGITRGDCHDPLNVPFYNCPFEGKDVVVPVDAIIGGPERAGQGWRMLMEQLAAGRGIMLPAQATAGTQHAARVAGAYSMVRRQFGMPVGVFEGVQEPLARIGGSAYILEAARRFTCGGLDAGIKPAVVTAIAKYQFTEALRRNINDAMDVLGGAAISRGPRNLLAHAYFAAPISITVEGANILTRSLMIFGQGAIRCHPWAYKEIIALQDGDIESFDQAFWGHVHHVWRNSSRTMLLWLSRGYFAHCPYEGEARRWMQKLSWASAQFALTADLAMGLYGGALKRKETLAGRFSDIFSWMYLASAVLRRWEADGRLREDLPLFRWSMAHAMYEIQKGFEDLYRNFDAPLVGGWFRTVESWFSRINPIGRGPRDEDAAEVVKVLQTPGPQRDRLLGVTYVPRDPEEALAKLERAFLLSTRADRVVATVRTAMKDGTLPGGKPAAALDEAVEKGVIGAQDRETVREAEAARDDLIQVDAFTPEEYHATAEGGGW